MSVDQDEAFPVPDEATLRDCLRQVIDPEVGANIVDLGLIYRVERAAQRVVIEMTMTSPACPMGEMMRDEVRAVLRECLPAACVLDVNLVWEPPWRPDMMSERTRQNLGW